MRHADERGRRPDSGLESTRTALHALLERRAEAPESRRPSEHPLPGSVRGGQDLHHHEYRSLHDLPVPPGANVGKDPNSKDPFPSAPYDPQDSPDEEYRVYVGYRIPRGKGFLGLPSGASITFQVPLALWDGDNLFIATDGDGLTSAGTPYGYDPTASIAIAGAAPVSNSTWVQGSSNYPAGMTPIVMFYNDETSLAVSTEALAQLGEVTFRDPYPTTSSTTPPRPSP